MKKLSRAGAFFALLLAPHFAFSQNQTRTTVVSPVTVSVPSVSQQLAPLSIIQPLTIPAGAAFQLPGGIPQLPAGLPVDQQAVLQVTDPVAPKLAPALADDKRAAAILEKNALSPKQNREKDGADLEDSHWAKVFDGITARAGKTADLPSAGSGGGLSSGGGYLSETRGLGGAELVSKLHEISGRGAKIKHYDEAKSFMFSTADHVVKDGKTGIVDAYSGVFVPGTGSDGGAYKERGDQNHDGYIDSGGMNVEHVWPQSFFAKAEPMRADLHHLMATFMHPNGERGNLPFGEVKGAPEYHNDAGAKMGNGVFEPPDAAKGRVARALLYFYTRYYDKRIFQGQFNQGFWDMNLPMLLRWNRQFPPSEFEKARNDAVESFQGNRNPFVDDYTLADRVGENAFKTGNRYGIRRGQANYGLTAQASVQPERVISGARLKPYQAPAQLQGPVRLIITGPPGSGKGTYSERLSAEYNVPHISVGELLRTYARTHPEVAAIMAKGQLVDTPLVLQVLKERLAQPDVKARGFILDGFPRREVEAKALTEMLGPGAIDGVISLDVPDEELLRRILARGRADDSEPVFQDRMKIYREQTVPAVESISKDAEVIKPEVRGSDAKTNYARVKDELQALLKRLGLLSR